MQRILSVETSRNVNQPNSEFVTKRFCCSFLLTVAFFSVVGGFLLGKFVSDRALDELTREMYDLSGKISLLNRNLQITFRTGLDSNEEYQFLKCNFSGIGRNQSGTLQSGIYLNFLNDCFNNG